jgi:hypothetical protein
MHLQRLGWRQSDRRLVRIASRRRSVVRHGAERLCSTLGSLLAGSPLRLNRVYAAPPQLTDKGAAGEAALMIN